MYAKLRYFAKIIGGATVLRNVARNIGSIETLVYGTSPDAKAAAQQTIPDK